MSRKSQMRSTDVIPSVDANVTMSTAQKHRLVKSKCGVQFTSLTAMLAVVSLCAFTSLHIASCDRLIPNIASSPLSTFFASSYGVLTGGGGGGGLQQKQVPKVQPQVGRNFQPHVAHPNLPHHLLVSPHSQPHPHAHPHAHAHHHHQRRHHGGRQPFGPSSECELNANPVIDHILDRMRQHLPQEKITVQNGAISIYDAQISRFVELVRLRSSCARRVNPAGTHLLLPFEAEIRIAHVQAKLKYNFYVTDIYGDYSANFSHIRMNGTLETNTDEEWMTVSQFNITSSAVVSDSILFGYVPKWILDWVRSYFDNDNTQMYEQLAKLILQKEADNFGHYDMLRDMVQPPTVDDDDNRLPLNRI